MLLKSEALLCHGGKGKKGEGKRVREKKSPEEGRSLKTWAFFLTA